MHSPGLGTTKVCKEHTAVSNCDSEQCVVKLLVETMSTTVCGLAMKNTCQPNADPDGSDGSIDASYLGHLVVNKCSTSAIDMT